MGLAMTLKDCLQREEHVVVAGDGKSGFNMAFHGAFDLLILDMMLPAAILANASTVTESVITASGHRLSRRAENDSFFIDSKY